MSNQKVKKLTVTLIIGLLLGNMIGVIPATFASTNSFVSKAYADDDNENDHYHDSDNSDHGNSHHDDDEDDDGYHQTSSYTSSVTTNQVSDPPLADNVDPKIYIFNPSSNNYEYQSDDSSFDLRGMVIDNLDSNPDVVITVGSKTYDQFGTVQLDEGVNSVTITAIDNSGNSTEKDLTITRTTSTVTDENINSDVIASSDSFTASFNPADINTTEPIQYYVSKAVEDKLISPFDPIVTNSSDKATRIDALRIILDSLGIKDRNGEVKTFSDVPAGSWYSDIVSAGANHGIINGFSDGTFKPMESITRAELLKILFNAYGIDLSGKYPRNASFNDEDNLHWSGAYLEAAKLNNIARGFGDGNFGPDRHVTRGELAKIALIAAKKSKEQYGFNLPELMPESERSTLLAQREMLQAVAKNPQASNPVDVPLVPSTPVDTGAEQARAQEIETQRQQELERQKAVELAAQQKAEAERIAREKAEAERLRLEQERLAQQEAARIAAQQAAAAAAASRARRSRRS